MVTGYQSRQRNTCPSRVRAGVEPTANAKEPMCSTPYLLRSILIETGDKYNLSHWEKKRNCGENDKLRDCPWATLPQFKDSNSAVDPQKKRGKLIAQKGRRVRWISNLF